MPRKIFKWKIPFELFRENCGTEPCVSSALHQIFGRFLPKWLVKLGNHISKKISGELKLLRKSYPNKDHQFILSKSKNLKSLKSINQVWLSNMAAFTILAPCLTTGECSHPRHDKTRIGLIEYLRWLFHLFAFTGFERTLRVLKSMSDWYEFYALFSENEPPPVLPETLGRKGKWLTFPWAKGHLKYIQPTVGPHKNVFRLDRREWFSFSLFEMKLSKRGFGLPTQKIIDASYEKHKGWMEQEIVPSLEEELLAEEFGEKFALEYSRTNDFKSFELRVNQSSCLEHFREDSNDKDFGLRSGGGRKTFSNLLYKQNRDLYYEIPKEFLNMTVLISSSNEDLHPICDHKIDDLTPNWYKGENSRNLYYDFFGNPVVDFSGTFLGRDPKQKGSFGRITTMKASRLARLPFKIRLEKAKFVRTGKLLFHEWYDQYDSLNEHFGIVYRNLILNYASLNNIKVTIPEGIEVIKPNRFKGSFELLKGIGGMDVHILDIENPFLYLYKDKEVFKLASFDLLRCETYHVHAVEDRGCKARIITIGSSPRVTLGHLFREACYKALARTNYCVLHDKDNPYMQNFFNRFEYNENYFLGSLDLTSATDTFPQKIIQSIAKGFIKGVKHFNESYGYMLDILLPTIAAPSKLVYPDKSIVFQKRGVLMGTTESWSLLNLFEEFCFQISKRKIYFGKDELSIGATPLVPSLHLRCGDDQITYCERPLLEEFNNTLIHFGAVPSSGTNCISKDVGVFTETLFSIKEDKTLNWIDILRVSSLVDYKGLNRLPELKEIPRIFFRAGAFNQAISWWKGDDWRDSVGKGIKIFCHYLLHDFLQSCSKMGLEIFLPQVFGGLGAPHPDGKELNHVRTRSLRVIISLLMENSNIEDYIARSSLSIWGVTLNNESDKASARVMKKIYDILSKIPKLKSLDQEGSYLLSFFDIKTTFGYEFSKNSQSDLLSELKEFCKRSKVVPLSSVIEEFQSEVRLQIENYFQSRSFMSVEQKIYKKAKLFNQLIVNLTKKVVIPKEVIKLYRNMSIDDLLIRKKICDYYIMIFLTDETREEIYIELYREISNFLSD